MSRWSSMSMGTIDTDMGFEVLVTAVEGVEADDSACALGLRSSAPAAADAVDAGVTRIERGGTGKAIGTGLRPSAALAVAAEESLGPATATHTQAQRAVQDTAILYTTQHTVRVQYILRVKTYRRERGIHIHKFIKHAHS